MRPLPAELCGSVTLHGLSAFSTVRTRHGRPLLLQGHLARLTTTCAFLGLPAPGSELPALPPLPWGLLRLTVTADGTFWSQRELRPPAVPAQGAQVWLSGVRVRPQQGRHKTGNYLPYLLAAREAEAQGATEALLTDHLGQPVDGSRSGLLLRVGGEYLIPDGGLPSVTRAAWLDELGEEAAVSPVSPELLRRADRVWLCGSGVGVVPVGRIAGEDWAQTYTAEWPDTADPALVMPT